MSKDYIVVDGDITAIPTDDPVWYKISMDKLLLLFGNPQESKFCVWWNIKLINTMQDVTIATNQVYKIGDIPEWCVYYPNKELERILGQELRPRRDLEYLMEQQEMYETLRGL